MSRYGRRTNLLFLFTTSFTPPADLAIVNGEDLARYRAASKNIFHLVRSLVWGQQVERLGLDELFMGTVTISTFI